MTISKQNIKCSLECENKAVCENHYYYNADAKLLRRPFKPQINIVYSKPNIINIECKSFEKIENDKCVETVVEGIK